MDALIRGLCLLLLLALPAPAARAGEIHACRDAQGARVFQDRPCAADATALGVRPIAARAEDPGARRVAREEARRIAAWERASRARLAPSLGGHAAPAGARGAPSGRRSTSRAASDACAKAREAREAAYRRDGNRMGFDRRRALQDAVINACGLR